MTTDAPWILDFSAASELAVVGGKALGLHRLTALALPVPPGFVITTSAFRAALLGQPEVSAALAALTGLQPTDTDEIRSAAARVREAVAAVPLPPALADQTLAAWRSITGSRRVAVRSSATAEDLAEASFAGQQDTYLDVDGDQLLARVRACWASLWSDRAVAYRLHHGLGAADVAMAVVVQRMLAPTAAGVLFTADPVTGRRGVCVLEAVAGLGEALVSGRAAPQVHRLRADGTVLELRVPAGEARLLSDAAAQQLCALGRRAADAFGSELDLEWALADDTAWLLQARAITTLPPIPGPRPADGSQRVYISFGHAQVNTAPLSPLAISILTQLLPLDRDPHTGASRLVATAGARVYIDVTPLLAQPPFTRLFPRVIGRASRQIAERLAAVVTRPELREQAPRVRVGLWAVARRVGPVLARAALGLLRGPARAHAKFLADIDRWLADLDRAQATAGPATRLIRLREHLLGTIDDLLFRIALPVLIPSMIGEAQLRAITRAHAPDEADDALLRGLTGNSTTEMDLELGDLADLARELPDLAAALTTDDPVAALAAQRARPEHARFFAAWDHFLARHGTRAAGELDLSLPRWHEQPDMLLRTLAGALSRAPGAHRRQHEAARAHAELVLAKVLRGARRGPLGPLRVARVLRLYRRVRTLLALREHHKAALVVLLDRLRQSALDVGAAMVDRGELASRDEVWLLSLAELITAAERVEHGRPPAPPITDLAARRDESRRYIHWSPAPVLTSDGEAVPAPPQADAPPNTLVGTGVSSGVYEGVVRVVRDPARETLAAGEVLVAIFTDPGWTPLFMHAGAVVIEVGGTLTHGSVIARELGIPAVVAVDGATRRLQTGQRVRVDGERGWVQVLP